MIEFGVNAWFLIPLFIIAALLTWISYRHTEPKLRDVYQWLLPVLRGLALVLLLTLLFEPVFQQDINHTVPPLQAVLIDESQSMPRHHLPDVLPEINGGETRFFGFGGGTRPIEDLSTATDTAPRTDIATALNDLKRSLRDQNLRSVLLISDGQYNTGNNPIYVAGDYGIPIHTLAIGDTLNRPDLLIAQVATNEIGFVGQEIPVDVTLLLQGYPNETITTRLYLQDSLITSETLIISEGESNTSLSLTAHQEGLFQYTVMTSQLPEEALTENNYANFTVRILRHQQTIALIAAAPHPDVITIRNILTRDEHREVDSYVQMQSGRFYEGSLPPSLNQYDALILVGFPGREADNASIEAVAKSAESGTPILFLLTRQTDLETLRTQLGNVLPATPWDGNAIYDEATIEITPTGLRDPLLSLTNVSWERLPPLIVMTGRWSVTPDSRILGHAKFRGISTQQPLLVIRNRVSHRSAAILGSGTWRWQKLGNRPSLSPQIWTQLAENLIQWLTTPDDQRTVRVEPMQTAFDGSEPILFSGQVYDESLNPVSDAIVTIEVTASDGTTYPYTMTNLGSGRFSLRIDTLPEDAYSFTAQASRMNASLGVDTGTFTVGSINIEYLTTSSNPTLLRQIAHQSGGLFFIDSTLHTLADHLASDSSFTPIIRTQILEQDLKRTLWILAVVVLLLGLEWILRKRNGLA